MGDLMQDWDKFAISFEELIKLTTGKTCLMGCDLSKKVDLTADAFIFLLGNDQIAITATGFIPEGAVKRHEQTDRIPYRDYAVDGWVKITQGEVVDYNEMKTHMHDVELNYRWNILQFCYDPYNATHFANDLEQDGYTCVEIRQGVRTLSEPTKLFRELLLQGKIIHDGSPLLKQHLFNAKEQIDSNGNIKLTKEDKDDTNRIDLIASVINALAMLPALKEEEGQDLSEQIKSDDWGM
jgi:phage terminase large subunit-like protein